MLRRSIFFILTLYLTLTSSQVLAGASIEVVIYTSLDQLFSEPIFQGFKRLYKIKVKVVYDVEAVKTVGLVNRLIAEKKNPHCDVFWNNEILQTIILKRKGILAPYDSPSASDIPSKFKDPEGYWAGFAARARVLVVNTDLISPDNFPESLAALTSDKWKGRAAMASPLFGTTGTHVAAMFEVGGAKGTNQYLKDLLANEVKIVDGNSVVRDMVASGEVAFGITDTDDANVGIVQGFPIKMIPPDQDGAGTMLIPNTVALIKNGPNPEAGKLLIDFILSRDVEKKLAYSESAQIPLREGIDVPKGQLSQDDLVVMTVDYERMADVMDESVKAVQNLFMR